MAKAECLQAECLQQKTGSCYGCKMMEIIKDNVNQGQSLEEAVNRVAEECCPNPDRHRPQKHLIKARRAGGMGQQKSSQVEIRR